MRAPEHTKPKSKAKTILLIVGLTGLGLVGLVGLFTAAAVLGVSEVEVSAQQREALHAADDVAEYFDFEINPAHEAWTGEKWLDGARTVSYEYDDPSPDSPYVSSELNYDKSPKDAAIGFPTMWNAMKLGLNVAGDEGVAVDEREDMLRWGEDSRVAFITHQGEPSGMLIGVRRQRVSYTVVLGGVYFEDAETLMEFMRPKRDFIEHVDFD